MRQIRIRFNAALSALTALLLSQPAAADSSPETSTKIQSVLESSDLVVLGDVKHGVSKRINFYSSDVLFEAMARAGVRHVAIEIPRVLGRQAMGIETEADAEAFVQDVIRSGRWHFVDPDRKGDDPSVTQNHVAHGLARQVLLAKKHGINPIFYDFNNPLGGFRTYLDPVYRCLAELNPVTWVKYGVEGTVAKEDRDAAIMRERFSHDGELADFIATAVERKGGGKVVVIPGYAHAVLPGGLTDRLENRLATKAKVVAVFSDLAERKGFHDFLWEQSRLLAINLSRIPDYFYTITTDALTADEKSGRFAALNGAADRRIPAVCFQVAGAN